MSGKKMNNIAAITLSRCMSVPHCSCSKSNLALRMGNVSGLNDINPGAASSAAPTQSLSSATLRCSLMSCLRVLGCSYLDFGVCFSFSIRPHFHEQSGNSFKI